jgi:RecJ-like exonuclease
MGDRGGNYKKACDLLAMHRQNLLDGINYVKEVGMTPLRNLQYFQAGNNILETIVGIVAGMSINLEGTNRKLPVVAFANSDEGIKVSARGTQELVDRRLNLASAINQAAKSVEGVGGGHDIAAGATIPFGTEEAFLIKLDEIIGQQMR